MSEYLYVAKTFDKQKISNRSKNNTTLSQLKTRSVTVHGFRMYAFYFAVLGVFSYKYVILFSNVIFMVVPWQEDKMQPTKNSRCGNYSKFRFYEEISNVFVFSCTSDAKDERNESIFFFFFFQIVLAICIYTVIIVIILLRIGY